jgi:hypothetical protein
MINSVETKVLSDADLDTVVGGNWIGNLLHDLTVLVPTSTSTQSTLVSGKAENYFRVAFHLANLHF